MEGICSIIEVEARKSWSLVRASITIKWWLIMTSAIIAYKFRISPSKAQAAKLENTLNLCRELYNSALRERKDAWTINRININRFDQDKQLPEIKQTNPEYKGIHSQVLQDVLKRLDKSFQCFFRRVKAGQKAGFPRFKGKSRFDSFCYAQSGFNLSGNKLTLSKIGKLKIRLSREIIGKVKTLTIKQECGKWFAIFTVAKAEELPKTGQSIGIDVGISAFATLSDGTQIDNFKYYESTQKKLRIAQRRVARRKKGRTKDERQLINFVRFIKRFVIKETIFSTKFLPIS